MLALRTRVAAAVIAAAAGVIVRRRLTQAADELVRTFASRLGAGFGQQATPQELERALEALRPLGAEAVRLIFAQEMQRAIGELTGAP
ncbi:MAG TPA: hypothetical protein VHX88_06455 [Solirubrobacteraceae bacterium]|jgi:hypothetical protein|nr:hypothetical protein [Solirubrobacteraceae bacterium]